MTLKKDDFWNVAWDGLYEDVSEEHFDSILGIEKILSRDYCFTLKLKSKYSPKVSSYNTYTM
jgi:hypothetical protein